MTNETRQRIEAYKSMLPDMKERVTAAAFLMVMSVIMMASASFAWITLSRAPEAAGMQTTVASNGNLEIALAQGSTVVEGEKAAAVVPGESQEGDSSAAEGQSVVEANATWGNLVNVSDPTYGLGDIALRPALLSNYSRTDYPLNGATYGGDGRVVTTNERYEFASYDKVEGSENLYQFYAGDRVRYGVRAISSVGYSNAESNVAIDNFRNNTDQLYREAQNYYGKIVAKQTNDVNTLNEAAGVTCISALEGLVAVFAQDKINAMGYGPSGNTGDTSCSPYIWYIYQMMLRLQTVLEKEGKAILEMANWQAYVASRDDQIEKTFKSIDELLVISEADLTKKGVKLTTLKSYKKSVEDLKTCINGLKDMALKCQNPDAPEEEYYWDDISDYVNILVHVNTTTMNGVELQKVNGISSAMDVLGGGDVVVYKGTLVDIEKRLVNNDNRVQADVTVSVRTSIPLFTNPKVNGTVYTDAFGKKTEFAVDFEYSDELKSEAKGAATAKDTYGLALDMWVRTNYPGAVLTLEGSAKYENQPEFITIENVEYKVHTISVGEDEFKTEVDIYQKDDKWYYVSTLGEVSTEDLGSQTPKEKQVPVIVGYEGENRIWEDWRDLLEGGYIEQDATTQGAGSCFVFYADTPTEQVKIMEMLEAFNVAFIDENGEILGTAQLNLGSAYANQGKVTVPLEVATGTEYTDESGVTQKGITRLNQNTPTMITAIVYLNGSKLQNENVLADGVLQGQLNIQFGTDSTLIAPDDEELQAQARSITATVTVGNETISNGIIGGNEGLEYKEEGYQAMVELTVDGEQPERISGSFIRVVNSTQGMKGEEKNFVYNSETRKWEAEFTLKNPGKYAFNTLLVDGVQYTLHDGTEQSGMNQNYPANRPYVNIKGLRVAFASVAEKPGTYMTAESSKNLSVTVKVEAAEKPRQVYAQFFSADEKKQYAALMTYDSINEQWVGSANIGSSGTYTLKYISVDGIPFDAPATGSYTLYLGLRANVSTTVPEANRTYDYIGEAKQFDMIVRIYDDSGKAIENLPNVMLHYSNLSPAELTWNGTYYEGALEVIKPGQMRFNKLELGDAGSISSVSGAPVFLARSLETPEYVSGEATHEKLVAIGDNLFGTLKVRLKDGETAAVWAEVEKDINGVKELRYLEGALVATEESTNISDIVFNLPREDGDWTLKRLFLRDVYDKTTGRWYEKTDEAPTEDNSFVILPKEEDKLSTDLIISYNVAVFYGNEEQGKYNSTENTSTVNTFTVDLTGGTPGAFLTEYTTEPITVRVTDYKNRKIDNVDVKNSLLQLNYDASKSEQYGGYTGPSSEKIDFTDKSVSDTVMSFGTKKLKQAGEYNTDIFEVSLGSAGTIDVLIRPKFIISSITPSAVVSGITPTGSNPAKITYTTKSASGTGASGTVPTFTATGNMESYIDTANNYAEVYAVSSADNSTQHNGSFTRPTLTLRVDGVDSGCNVSLNLPGGSADSITFSRTGNGTITNTLGKTATYKTWTSKSYWVVTLTHTLNKYSGHEEQTISTMSIEKDGKTYTVKLPQPIVIKNPSSVNQ